nr:MAG: hypothetical protein DIU70_08555 [Bacillota bacterium]
MRTDSVPVHRADPRREAIRRELLKDVLRLKLVAFGCVAAAGVTFFLTKSVLLYILLGLLGAAGIHVLGFLWARQYLASAAPRREERQAAPRREGLKVARRREGRRKVARLALRGRVREPVASRTGTQDGVRGA